MHRQSFTFSWRISEKSHVRHARNETQSRILNVLIPSLCLKALKGSLVYTHQEQLQQQHQQKQQGLVDVAVLMDADAWDMCDICDMGLVVDVLSDEGFFLLPAFLDFLL